LEEPRSRCLVTRRLDAEKPSVSGAMYGQRPDPAQSSASADPTDRGVDRRSWSNRPMSASEVRGSARSIRFMAAKARWWLPAHRSENVDRKVGLAEDRKALVERYMIDAEEAQGRAVGAAEEQARREAEEERAREAGMREEAR